MPVTQDEQQSRKSDATGLKTLVAGTARLALATGVRQVLTMGALAVTAAIVARYLGPREFGEFAGGTAAFNLINGLTDLGFSIILLRELGSAPESEQGLLLGTAVLAQTIWGALLAACLAVMAIAAHGVRGELMLILIPAILLNGLAASRSIFGVRYIAKPLLIMDITTTLAQCAAAAVLVVNHASVEVLAINLSFWYALTYVVAIALARRQLSIKLGDLRAVWVLLRRALPLGVASVLASLYFTIDLTLLGWLVAPSQLALYAVDTRVLTIVVTVPGFVMAAGIPALAKHATNRHELGTLAGTFASWLTVTALPLLVGIGIFAHPIIGALFGFRYYGAVPVLRILMLAGLLALSSNVSGVILMTKGILRPQIIFNGISLALNVAGNLILTPRFGIQAAAWLTVLSELIVASYGLVVLRRSLAWGAVFGQIAKPILAVLLAAVAGLSLGASGAVAVASYPAIFVLFLTFIGGWPEALTSKLSAWSRLIRP